MRLRNEEHWLFSQKTQVQISARTQELRTTHNPSQALGTPMVWTHMQTQHHKHKINFTLS